MKNIDIAISVNVTDRAGMESGLDEAVAIARTLAMEEGRRGILVTRDGIGSFTVALTQGGDPEPQAPALHRRQPDPRRPSGSRDAGGSPQSTEDLRRSTLRHELTNRKRPPGTWWRSDGRCNAAGASRWL